MALGSACFCLVSSCVLLVRDPPRVLIGPVVLFVLLAARFEQDPCAPDSAGNRLSLLGLPMSSSPSVRRVQTASETAAIREKAVSDARLLKKGLADLKRLEEGKERARVSRQLVEQAHSFLDSWRRLPGGAQRSVPNHPAEVMFSLREILLENVPSDMREIDRGEKSKYKKAVEDLPPLLLYAEKAPQGPVAWP